MRILCKKIGQLTEAYYFCSGGVAEWSNASVLKTEVPQGTGGSNPSASALNTKAVSHTRRPFFDGGIVSSSL